jgi:hypothetical protein
MGLGLRLAIDLTCLIPLMFLDVLLGGNQLRLSLAFGICVLGYVLDPVYHHIAMHIAHIIVSHLVWVVVCAT